LAVRLDYGLPIFGIYILIHEFLERNRLANWPSLAANTIAVVTNDVGPPSVDAGREDQR